MFLITKAMGKYFSISELCKSETAESRHIDNQPTPEVVDNLELLIEMMDKIREKWGSPIRINSGYRCPKLNTAVKGAKNSSHMLGLACDFQPVKGKKSDLFKMIKEMIESGEITVSQLIWEYGTKKEPQWIHIALPREGKAINQILYLL